MKNCLHPFNIRERKLRVDPIEPGSDSHVIHSGHFPDVIDMR